MVASSFVVHPTPAAAPLEMLAAFQNVVTPHISDNLQRLSGIVGL